VREYICDCLQPFTFRFPSLEQPQSLVLILNIYTSLLFFFFFFFPQSIFTTFVPETTRFTIKMRVAAPAVALALAQSSAAATVPQLEARQSQSACSDVHIFLAKVRKLVFFQAKESYTDIFLG
jgi:hypothetical protein